MSGAGASREAGAADGVSQVPGAEGWRYGAFVHDPDDGTVRVPLVRADGYETVFALPDFVNDGRKIRDVALVVIGALEEWEARKGLGA